MKKIISIFCVLMLLFSMFAVSVSAEENYCKLFEEQWFALTRIDEYGNEETPWSANAIAYITALNFDYEGYYSTEKSTDIKECYAIPEDEFEALAAKLFDIKVDLKTANFSSMSDVIYDSATKTYDLIFHPTGGGSSYIVYGYSKLNDIYTVYMQKESDGEYLGEYVKATATCDGTYAKLISLESIGALPAENSLITPKDISDSVSSELPSSSETSSSATASDTPHTNLQTVTLADKYNVTISAANGVFSADTVVTILKKTDTEELSRIKSVIGKDYSKFTAFDFSATENGSPVQPEGKVNVTFKLPVDYDVDNIAVLFVPDIGEAEAIPVTVNKTARTVTVELTHFSTYVFAELCSEEPVDQDEGPSVLLIVFIVLIVVFVLGGGAAWYFFVFRKKKTK